MEHSKPGRFGEQGSASVVVNYEHAINHGTQGQHPIAQLSQSLASRAEDVIACVEPSIHASANPRTNARGSEKVADVPAAKGCANPFVCQVAAAQPCLRSCNFSAHFHTCQTSTPETWLVMHTQSTLLRRQTAHIAVRSLVGPLFAVAEPCPQALLQVATRRRR
jgi:hypothetical protein